jgi:hypothetical protein
MIVVKALTVSDVEFSFTAEPEYDHPADLGCDPESVAYIGEETANGNDAAWFCAKVTATWNGYSESTYLGGCSYKSFDEFLNDEYYKDMQREAVSALNGKLQDMADLIEPLLSKDS